MQIEKYRNKPVEIEAIQYTGKNHEEILAFAREKSKYEYNYYYNNYELSIKILHIWAVCPVGAYVIRHTEGVFSPLQEEKFNATYDKINQ
jgi:hypothetical protein